MRSRAPVVVQCVRRNGQWGFRVRGTRRSNPATDAQLMALYGPLPGRFRKKYSTHSKRDDIVQEALAGLVKARNDYDPSKGEWEPYAYKIAENFVNDFLRKDQMGGRSKAEAGRSLKALRADFQKAHPGVAPPYTVSQLADHAGLPVEEIHEMMTAAMQGQQVSTSAGVAGGESEDGDSTIEDTLTDATAEQVEGAVAIQIEEGRRKEKVKTLSRMEQLFDAYMRKGKPIAWIARQMKMSETKAREIAASLRAHTASPESR